MEKTTFGQLTHGELFHMALAIGQPEVSRKLVKVSARRYAVDGLTRVHPMSAATAVWRTGKSR